VVLPAEPQPDKPQPAKKPADDEAFTTDGLAWISELKVLGGKERTIELADFKGKPMYLNLLGSRDTESLPQVLALYEKYADRGLVILVICTDGSTQVEELVKKHELPFTVAADVDGYAVDVFRRGRSEPGHPSNVVLNAQGERIFREVGFDGDKLDRLEAAIEQALGGSK
jgi:peroxiredoxin